MKINIWKKYLAFVFVAIIAIITFDKIQNYFNYRETRKLAEEITNTGYETEYKTIEKLITEVQISYFDDLLGKPTFLYPHESYTYVKSNYFVHVTTDESDKVASFAITTRNNDFQPIFESKGLYKVQLNATPFSEWLVESSSPQSCFHFQGAHDPMQYFEKSFFGNVGNYQTFSVGITNSGNFVGMPSIKSFGDDLGGLGQTDCKRISDEDRNNFKPNTFVVIGKGAERNTWINLGPDSLQTRLLRY